MESDLPPTVASDDVASGDASNGEIGVASGGASGVASGASGVASGVASGIASGGARDSVGREGAGFWRTPNVSAELAAETDLDLGELNYFSSLQIFYF